jgi:hypothetical protein
MAELKERLTKFGLSLHEDKTRLIEFGRLPALARQRVESGQRRGVRLTVKPRARYEYL